MFSCCEIMLRSSTHAWRCTAALLPCARIAAAVTLCAPCITITLQLTARRSVAAASARIAAVCTSAAPFTSALYLSMTATTMSVRPATMSLFESRRATAARNESVAFISGAFKTSSPTAPSRTRRRCAAAIAPASSNISHSVSVMHIISSASMSATSTLARAASTAPAASSAVAWQSNAAMRYPGSSLFANSFARSDALLSDVTMSSPAAIETSALHAWRVALTRARRAGEVK